MQIVRFRLINRPLPVMRRCIDHGKFQRYLANINDIVPVSRWYKHCISAAHALLQIHTFSASANLHDRIALLHSDILIHVFMKLRSCLFAGRNTHFRHLQITSCPYSSPIIPVLYRALLRINYIRIHAIISLLCTFLTVHAMPHIFLLNLSICISLENVSAKGKCFKFFNKFLHVLFLVPYDKFSLIHSVSHNRYIFNFFIPVDSY